MLRRIHVNQHNIRFNKKHGTCKPVITIKSSKPPIFWKDKEIVKQQIYKWKSKDLKELIYKINEIELYIKKNINNSINLVIDFILKNCSNKSNN